MTQSILKDALTGFGSLVRRGREVTTWLSFPEVAIPLSSDPDQRHIYRNLTKPHPRLKVVQNKRWGVALLPLPDVFDEYLKGKDKQALRTNRNRALSFGFQFRTIDPLEHLDEILAVNASMQYRQERRMDPQYLSMDHLRTYFAKSGRFMRSVMMSGFSKPIPMHRCAVTCSFWLDSLATVRNWRKGSCIF
jgi:hypothetical protein